VLSIPGGAVIPGRLEEANPESRARPPDSGFALARAPE
jgi:hypothetical protein